MFLQAIYNLRKGDCSACLLIGGLVVLSLVYWGANHFVTPKVLNDLVDGPLIMVSFMAGAYYLSWSLWNCHFVVTGEFLLRLGICMAWVGNGIWRVSRFLYAEGILHGSVGAHDPWRGYMIVIMTLAGMLHIVAIDYENPKIRKVNGITALLAVLIGFIFMSVIHARESWLL